MGQLPWHLSHLPDGEWTARLVTHRNSPAYDTIPLDDRFSIDFLPDSPRPAGVSLAALRWIWREGPQADAVQLFHLRFQTLLYAVLLRLRCPGVVLYLKTDLDEKQFEDRRPLRDEGASLRGRLKRAAFSMFLDVVAPLALRTFDLVSGETRGSTAWLRRQFPGCASRIFHLPNGLTQMPEQGLEGQLREKWILTVGRLGSYQKHNELLVDAAAAIDLNGWKVVFCGPCEGGIEDYARARLGDAAVFTGPIEDRDALYDLFRRARCFCLTSRFESFAFVLLEAWACGGYLVSTDVGVAADLIEAPEDGRLVRGVEELRAALLEVVSGSTGNRVDPSLRQDHALRLYGWPGIATALRQRLEAARTRRRGFTRAS